MPGSPMKRQIILELERRAVAASTPEEPMTALDVVHDFVAAGQTLRDLAGDIGTRLKRNDISAGVLGAWIHKQEGGSAMLEQARKLAAHGMADEALEIVDQVDEDKSAIAKAKLRAEQRMKMAAAYNRRDFGSDGPSVAVTFDMGQLHIDAMRQRMVTAVVTPALPVVEGADYEIIGDTMMVKE